MEQRIRERFTDDMLVEALTRFGVNGGLEDDRVQALDGFESFIYEFQRDSDLQRGRHYILRIGHSQRRSESLILGEVDWINYLAEGDASVSRAIRSERGRLVEAIDDGHGDQFLATAFVKAQGKPPSAVAWTPALYETYGRTLGRMHALSRSYRPTDPIAYRPQWDDPIMIGEMKHLPASEALAASRFQEVIDHLAGLPQTEDAYGLIHFDAHPGNMFVDEDGVITLFDFDDCHYQWYANDIAIVLFYNVMGHADQRAFTDEFLTHFLRGYRQENQLDSRWLAEIPWFLKQREIDLYAIIHRSFDVDHLDDPWCAAFMAGRKDRIEHGVPYIDFDFESMVKWLV